MNKEELKKIIDHEGNYESFVHCGYPCRLIRRAENLDTDYTLFHWCGYVGVPQDHPAYGKNYSTWSESEQGISPVESAVNDISVHGGLTFAASELHYQPEKDLWWFGFDCAHAGDISSVFLMYSNDTYKTKEYVIEEVKSLAEQLKKIEQINNR